MYIPPDVERKLKSSDENTLIYFPGSISQSVFACPWTESETLNVPIAKTRTSVGIETFVFGVVIVGWVIFIESWTWVSMSSECLKWY